MKQWQSYSKQAAAEIQTKDHMLRLTQASHKRFAEQNATL